MSWKGIQKSVVRAPQSLRQRLNIGEQTKDAVFIDAERRFRELEIETKKLHDESGKYFAAINSMLTHQIEFSKAIEEIYNPISGRASDPNAAIPEGNPEGIKACEMYREIVGDLQATLQPELEMLDTRIVKPADEMLEIVKNIRKLVVKRAHKQLDLDRHTNSLKKLQEKKDKSLKDEKALYKVENDVELATQEYNYYNDLLKDDLPRLFELETEFIKPLFQSFYYMQLNIFYTLYDRMNQANIPYFNMSADDDIEKAYEAKRGNIQERAEQIPITKFNLQYAKNKKLPDPKFRKYSATGAAGAAGSTASPYSPDGSAPPPYTTSGSPQPGYDGYQSSEYGGYSPTGAAPYSPSTVYGSPGTATAYAPQAGYQQPAGTGYSQAGALPGYQQPTDPQYAGYPIEKKAAPLPPSKPSGLSSAPGVEHCIAQFDYVAQADGDLSFNAGDRIEIVQRTADPNGWWTGRLNGYEGVFPGNYVAMED
ncbi:BAR domain-containing protein [Lipomyces kononenkoae]